ncbi:Cytochrome c oxidase subunit VIb [Lasiodiplodia theobromae]|uniref:Cytochrome c oxidase subunit vib n=1 Tax=Lasiodiplodia theobromae TaxID=45133 RepID=UPI0015C383FA|nr:Cytochrome c oxidase subunit vib [Lasiodiplodia theobromae]KAF4543043.1 Cytochrome c oxidase subunit vib [Lasiodiplodia theobromae]KAF9635614.1 Cytochrome c oxidase subunit VIb [Lasiodiplodia theobromae]
MGWFSSSTPAGPKPSSDGAFEAPDRSSRAQCWEARDAFFQCLDRHDIIDSVTNKDEAAAHCGREDKAFAQNCASSWVSRYPAGAVQAADADGAQVQYFKKRRVVEYKKEATLKQLQAEGARPLSQSQA